MLLALAVLLLSSPGDPPIRVKISDDAFPRGAAARVQVRAAADGYLLVLRADTQGRIRVLFPIDPTDAAAIPGGHEFEIRGRGDRVAFTVDDSEGSGRILAAWSAKPFQFDTFTRSGHWDYSALAAQASRGDVEATLVSVVDRMTGVADSSRPAFDYDIVTYTVSTQAGYRHPGGWVWSYGPFGPGWYAAPSSPWYYGPTSAATVSIFGAW